MADNDDLKNTWMQAKELIRKTVLTLASLFLLYQSAGLVHSLAAASSEEFNWGWALILGYLLTLFITGVVAFLSFAWPVSRCLPEGYYQIKQPDQLEKWYQYLGVEYFRKVLLVTFWSSTKNREKYFDGSRSGLANLDFQSRQSEFGHLIPFVAIALSSTYLLFTGQWKIFIVASFFNILGNLYPVILQRKHRMRIAPLMRRLG